MAQVPDDLFYTKEHEWAQRRDDLVRIGITDYAQDALGDIVYVQLPQIGDTVTAGDVFGEVESTKSVSDVYAPIGGTVATINDVLNDSPELANSDPYDEGWLIDVRPDDPASLDQLLCASDYRRYLDETEGSS